MRRMNDNTITVAQTLYLQLLQIALGTRLILSRELSEEEWNQIFQLSEIQTQQGVVFSAIALLPNTMRPPRRMLLRWAAKYKQLEILHSQHVRTLSEIHLCLTQRGIPHCFMKGLTSGSRYPQPCSRNCGDIDFFVRPADFLHTLEALSTIGRVDRDAAHEQHGTAFVHGIVVEPHYKLHNFQHPTIDTNMKKETEKIWTQEMPRVAIFESLQGSGCSDVPVLPAELEGVYLVGHMTDHFYGEGLGLRQLTDFMMWATKCVGQSGFNIDQHSELLKELRMERPHRVFTRVCEQYLGMSVDIFNYQYSQKEMSFADIVMADLLRVGNFGRGERTSKNHSRTSVLSNYLWVSRRAISLSYLSPQEAYIWPFSKCVRFFYKKFNPQAYMVG